MIVLAFVQTRDSGYTPMLRQSSIGRFLLLGTVLTFILSTALFAGVQGDASEGVSTITETVDASNELSDVFTDEQKQALEKDAVSFSFQAEVSRLLDTFINSLYTQKDVFLRELISNAADALEKARFMAVSDPNYLAEFPDLEIRVAADKDAKTLTIQDTGVGMTKKELIENLGTVAQSGTTNFLEAMANGGDINLIGQFGVGFYSAFLVADKVTVTSKSSKDPDQYIWESTVNSSFTIARDPRGNTLRRGTRITLHLRDDSTEFLEPLRLQLTILKYNQFLTFPVKLQKERAIVKEAEDSKDADEKAEKDVDDVKLEEDDEDKVKTSKKTETERYWEIINKEKPLWLRPKEDVTPAEYSAFYKTLTHSRGEPLAYTHFVGEGEVEFKSIIYIPSVEGVDAWGGYFSAKQHAIKLYARRVLVADAFYEVLPKWLNFIKGVVDSDDLPLKVDRESLSQDRVMRVITRKVIGKFFDLLKKMVKEDNEALAEHKKATEEAEKKGVAAPSPPATNYTRFWDSFQKGMWVGCVEDDSNRAKIVDLLRFHSTKTGLNETISLSEYVARMPESQKSIYYISLDNYDGAMASPHVQIYKKKDYEVLILMEPLQEPCLERVLTHQTKRIVSVEKSNAKLESTEEEKKLHKRIEKAYKPLTDYWMKQLNNDLSGVRVSTTLVDDPAVIVSSLHGYGAFNERVIRSQTFGSFQERKSRTRFLDINPHHPLIQKLLALVKEAPDDPQLEQITQTLYETALFSSGFLISNPAPLSRKFYKLLQAEVGVGADATINEFVPPESDGEDDTTVPEEKSDIDFSDMDFSNLEDFQSLAAEQRAAQTDAAFPEEHPVTPDAEKAFTDESSTSLPDASSVSGPDLKDEL